MNITIATILMLGVATSPPGVGDAEQSQHKLLPEATVLSAVDGKVVHESRGRPDIRFGFTVRIGRRNVWTGDHKPNVEVFQKVED